MNINNDDFWKEIDARSMSHKEEVKILKAERDSAREELRKIREAIGANPEESTYDEVVRLKYLWDYYHEFCKHHGSGSITELVVQRDNVEKELSQIHSILKCVSECPPQSPDDTVTVSMLKGLCLHYLKLAEKEK